MGRAKRDVHICPLLPIPAHKYVWPLDYYSLNISTSFKFFSGKMIIKRCNGHAKRDVHICPLLRIPAHKYVSP
jgi:hypothetical protein